MMGEDKKGLAILKNEIFISNIRKKEGKAVGVDEISTEMFMILGEKAQREIYDILQNMYDEGKRPVSSSIYFFQATTQNIQVSNNCK